MVYSWESPYLGGGNPVLAGLGLGFDALGGFTTPAVSATTIPTRIQRFQSSFHGCSKFCWLLIALLRG